MLMVLFGALLHAGWNAMVKSGGDKLREAGLVVGGAAAVSLVLLPFVPLPDAAAGHGWSVRSSCIRSTTGSWPRPIAQAT